MVHVEHDRIERLLDILSHVSLGNYERRVDVDEEGGDDEFLELEVAFNMLLDELQWTHERITEQQREIEQQAVRLAAQEQDLAQAQTPILVVSRGVLALPIIGAVEAERAQSMTGMILERVVRERATHVILDLTGAGPIAPATAGAVVRMAQAVRMLGARCLLTGISPKMARALVALDFDSSQVLTLPQLANALDMVLDEKARGRGQRNSAPAAGGERRVRR